MYLASEFKLFKYVYVTTLTTIKIIEYFCSLNVLNLLFCVYGVIHLILDLIYDTYLFRKCNVFGNKIFLLLFIIVF